MKQRHQLWYLFFFYMFRCAILSSAWDCLVSWRLKCNGIFFSSSPRQIPISRLFYSLRVFPLFLTDDFFHWNLSDSKSPQYSWTLLRILANPNGAVVWISILPPISNTPVSLGTILKTRPCFPSFSILWQDLSINSSFYFLLFSA